MKLTKKDRITLANQYKILAALDSDSSKHYGELVEILENGYEIFYPLIGEWFNDDMPRDSSRLVLNILDLYRAIEDVKRRTKDNLLLTHPFSIFRGFDGNNETNEMAFCRFLIERQGKYEEQKQYLPHNDNLNSHMPMTDKYRGMLAEAKRVNIWEMSAESALRILNSERIG